MTNTLKSILGILIAVVALFVLALVWQWLFPAYGYRMMGGYGWHMPMMGFGFMPFGMLFMWLIPLGTLVLIILGIVWLVKNLTLPKS